MLRSRAARTAIDSNETVVLYPAIAHYDTPERAWHVRIRGCVVEPGKRTLRQRFLLKILQKAMRARPEDMVSETFKRRIDGFLQKSEGGKRITLRVGDHIHQLKKKSKRNGHFRGTLRIPNYEMDRFREMGVVRNEWLNYEVISGNGDARTFAGRVRLVPPSGLSVISDIDDTMKVSEVCNRSGMLANTFLRDHRAIPGMAAMYRRWHEQDAIFHYVSSTPWQMYDCLTEFCSEHGFPDGTFHLKKLRLRDPSVLRLFIARRWGKRLTIARILRALPQRRFILVGDSGEKDPEIYGAMARKFPDRVEHILIRHVDGRRFKPTRYEKAFRDFPTERWCVFEEPGQLMETPVWSRLCPAPSTTTW